MTDRTIIVVWVCFLVAILIMAARLIGGRLSKQKPNIGDALTVIAIFLSLARIALTHVIVLWKTNNVNEEVGATFPLSTEEVDHREIGSKFTLVARCLYISLLWIQKGVLLDFYRTMVQGLQWGRTTMIIFLAVFMATFASSIIVTFTECRPFRLYWTVVKNPDKCTQAIVQLFVVGGCNIATDVMLILLPVPVLLKVRLSTKKKAQLAFLFSIGLLIVIVTAVRLPTTLNYATSETIRITWTTAEFLAATFVANAPTLYAIQHRLTKKTEAPRRFSVSGPHLRRSMRGRTLDPDGNLEGTPAVTPPSQASPDRGTNKDISGATTLETSMVSSVSKLSTLDVTQVRMSEEGPGGEKK